MIFSVTGPASTMFPQVFGKYVLERELSRGGMARVLLATLRGAGGFEKRLVVKQIRDELAFDQQFVRRFVEEAKTTVALSHPNIVPVYELGVEQGTYFLAMELVEGVSVADLAGARDAAGKKRVLSPEEGAYIGVEVCRALDYAHRRMKVVHRDITPRNVMIDEEGQVKLIDFGIAAPALVAGHEILGSPGHMAPEQLDGGELGPPTDIFAVAVLLLEAWTGTAPFRRATPEACAAAVHEAHPKPSDFDPRLLPLDEPIARALRLAPRDRQQEASELARSLRAFLQGADVEDVARSLGERVREIRNGTADASPPSIRDEDGPRTAGPGSTRTFATNAVALQWSPPPPKTRKVEDDAPSSSSRPSAETIATRPLATPIDAITPAPRRRSGAAIAIVSAAALAALVFARSRGDRTDEPTPPSPPVPTTTIVVASVSAPPSLPEPPASVASSAVPIPSAPPSVASAAPVARANVTFLGEPGTRVTVDGAARGPCPVRIALEPGRHDVRFTFDPTGESRGEPVTLKSGEQVTVRAEFTGATPTIRVQR